VLVGRPYNLYDRSVNCDIPRKLRTLYGINVLPMEVLPLDEEDISGLSIPTCTGIRAAHSGGGAHVRRHANLHLVYISNFKCGPDSYIKSFVRRSRRQALAGAAV
jgi:predicted nucleotide-binding protein (sugar kinase/HSP70/actin superfamily)